MFKYMLLLVVIFSFSFQNIAQDSGLSFEVHYPLIFSDKNNTYSDTSGVLGGVLQYQFTDNIPFNFGVEYKFDLLQTVENLSEFTEPTKRNFLINNLNVFSKMLFVTIPELQLYTSAGFTTYKYKNTTAGRSHIGFNAGAGLSYDIFEQIYFLASYSFIKATLKQNDGESLTSDKHHLVRLGAGFKF